MLSSCVRGEVDSVKDGLELVSRFRRFLDPDCGLGTPTEVAALSEYLARVDALVHALDQDADQPVYVLRSIHEIDRLSVFSDHGEAERAARRSFSERGIVNVVRDKDKDGRVGFYSPRSASGVGLPPLRMAVIDAVHVDAMAAQDADSG